MSELPNFDPKDVTSIPNSIPVLKVREISKIDYNEGIILEDIDDIKTVLQQCNGGNVLSEAETLASEKGIEAAGFFLQAQEHLPEKENTIEKIVAEAGKLSNGGLPYVKRFDYGNTPDFFKSTIKIEMLEDKYVMSIYYDNTNFDQEIQISKSFKKPRALRSVEIKIKVDSSDGYWFNIDLIKLLESSLKKEEIEEFGSGLLNNESKGIPYTWEDTVFNLKGNISSSRYNLFIPEKVPMLELRGTNIVGESWIKFDRSGPKVKPYEKRYMTLTMTYPDSDNQPIVDISKALQLKSARDQLYEQILTA